MSSTVRLVDKRFYSQLNNGDDFTLNPSDFASTLKGGVTEAIKAIFTVQVDWQSYMTTFDVIMDFDTSNTVRITDQTVNFKNDGIQVGDSVKWSVDNSGTKSQYTGIVTSITGSEIVIGSLVFVQGTSISDGIYSYANITSYITGITDLTSLNYKFGLIENSDSFSTLSKLTNSDQSYSMTNIDHNTPLTWSNGISLGNNKAWVTGSSRVSFSQLVLDKDLVYNENTTQEFIIEHTFRINPLYRDGEIDSLKGIDVPPTDIYNGNLSLKYVFETEFRTVANDPNTSKIAELDTLEGSVGYLNESFNGFPNRFTNTTPTYYDVTNSVALSKIDVNTVTRVTFSVTSLDSVFAASMPFIVGHSSIVDSLKYSNSSVNYNETWLNETARTTEGATAYNGDIIKNYTVTFVNSGQIDVSFDLDYSSNQVSQLINDQYYILTYTVQDPSEDVQDGGKVVNRLDVNQYTATTDIEGLFTPIIFDQYPHPNEFQKGVTQGFSSGKLFIEDGQLANFEFDLLDEYENSDVNLDSFRINIIAYNSVTGNSFNLRSLDVDLSSQVLVGNIQQINLNSNRGYILKDSDIFNSLVFTSDSNDGTSQRYSVQVGYKIPWQDWVQLIGADTVFYDNTKPFNGLNGKSSNYTFANDYKLRISIEADISVNDITTTYRVISGEFTAYEYDTDDLTPDGFTAQISTHDINGNSLSNNIIVDSFTEMRAIFTPSATNTPSFSVSVDFTDVANDWSRFAHGNKFLGGGYSRIPNWIDSQADDVDTFGDGISNYNKNDGSLYTTTSNSILTNQNCNAVYGMYSQIQYEYYQIKGNMYSQNNDNDAIKYDIAFLTDEVGVEHTLSLVATTGGIELDISPDYIPNDDTTSTIKSVANGYCKWALVYDMGKSTAMQIEEYETTEFGWNWNAPQVNDFIFDVIRQGNDLTINASWEVNGTNFTNTINYNLNNNPETVKFIGLQYIGFSFISQNQGGFRNVEIIDPSTDYYGILRMEELDSPTDFGISELSTIIEAPNSSALKQLTGSDRKSLLSWDGTSFIVQGLVDDSKVDLSKSYKLSAELRKLALTDSYPEGSEFEFVVDTDLDSPNDQFSLPITNIGGSIFVDFGDGSSAEITSISDPRLVHTYSSTGIYTIKLWGDYIWSFNNSGDKSKITSVVQYGTTFKLTSGAFYGCNNLTTVAGLDSPIIDGELNAALRGCSLINDNLNHWDWSKATNLTQTLMQCTAFNNGGVQNNWDIQPTISMESMMHSCSIFNQNVNHWDVTSPTLIGLSSIFVNCSSFNNGDSVGVSNTPLTWSPTSVGYNLINTFKNALAFNQEVDNLINIGCVNTTGTFSEARDFNQNLDLSDMSSVTHTTSMFNGAPSFNNGLSSGVSGVITWATSSFIDTSKMFKDAIAFNCHIPNVIFTNVTDASLMYEGSILSTANVGTLYALIASQLLQSNVHLGMGTLTYPLVNQVDRDILTNAPNNWVVTDGGVI